MQSIDQSSFSISNIRTNEMMELIIASSNKFSFTENNIIPIIFRNWPQRVNIGSNDDLVCQQAKRPEQMMPQTLHVKMIPEIQPNVQGKAPDQHSAKTQAYTFLNLSGSSFLSQLQRKSFWQLEKKRVAVEWTRR